MIVSTKLALLALSLLSTAAAHYDTGKVITVKAGGCIQDALDKATAGDKVVVEGGTYNECLTMTKDSITLIGKNGAILQPGSCTKTNTCTGLVGDNTHAGICITGDVELTSDVVNKEHRKVNKTKRPIKNVKVSGFTISGIYGLNIAIVGGQYVDVSGNTCTDGSNYGVLTIGSYGTRVHGNSISSADITKSFIGICMDDFSDVVISHNEIWSKTIGLCVQTNKAKLVHNVVKQCCIGANVDPYVTGAVLRKNVFADTNKNCKGTVVGSFNLGILLQGASYTEVSQNEIYGITNYGATDIANFSASGIGISDDFAGSGAKATNNKIDGNVLYNNDFDIGSTATGPTEFKNNKCTNGLPAEACSAK